MTIRSLILISMNFAVCTQATASDLAYTFMDFQVYQQDVEAVGTQQPVLGQTVDVLSDSGDGIAIAGSVAVGDRFYLSGNFQSAIIDLAGVITNAQNPQGLTVQDDFDLIRTGFSLGYLREIGANLDLFFELNYDSADYDFGSFAGENFDMDDGGAGARIGFRWNPNPSFEFFGAARHTSVGEARLDALEFESDSLVQLGLRWYFFEDLGVGLEYETGQVDTLSLSMRFSFGNLPW